MLSPVKLPLGSHSVGQTPIYDQLRGERITADVPPSPPDLHHPARPTGHRLSPETPGAAAAVARHQRRVWTFPTTQPANEDLEARRVRGTPAAIPPEAHARTTAPPHPGALSPPAAGYRPAAPAAVAGGGASGYEAVEGARSVPRTDLPRAAAAREAVFPWFGGLKIP
jgi:hypothetical protein